MGSLAPLAIVRRARATAAEKAQVVQHIDYALPRSRTGVADATSSVTRRIEAIGREQAGSAEFVPETAAGRWVEWTGGENAANDNDCAQDAREAA